MSQHEQDSASFIKTPQQLITVILLAFLVPIFGIYMLVTLVVNRPKADPKALTPLAVAERIQPLGRVEVGTAGPGAGATQRSGEEMVKTVCAACHTTGVAKAPKIGNAAEWAGPIKSGLPAMLKTVISGKNAMPPRAGASDATDLELTRAIIHMANQAGGKFKEPSEAPAAPAKAAAKGK